MKSLKLKLILLLLALALPLSLFAAHQQQQLRSKAQSTSFSFAAGGDFGNGPTMSSTMDALAGSGVNFLFALGDLSYEANTEQQWCNTVKSKIQNVAIVAGDHDVGESVGGQIANYIQNCPFTLGNVTGEYGKQYYFDYPQGAPLARFIAISPSLLGSMNSDYSLNSEGYNFTRQAIDSARSSGIKWIIVGMHKNCITPGERDCEVPEDLFSMLIEKRVDLILQSHDNVYARSHTLTCHQVNSFNVACVADNGDDGVHNYGEGSVLIIAGTGGQAFSEVSNSDGEKQFFTTTQGNTFGVPKFTVTRDAITGQFIRSAGGNFTDSFTIGTPVGGPSLTPPGGGTNPTLAASPTTPQGVTPTIYCVGGVGAPPCAPISPTSNVAPTGGSNPSTSPNPSNPPVGGTNPTPSVAPCPTADSASIMHNKKKKKKKSGGFLEMFFKFLLKLIEYFLGGGAGPIPGIPNPNPTPCPEPTTPAQPTTQPTDVPSPTTAPTVNTTPTTSSTPSTAPTQAAVGGTSPSGETLPTGDLPGWKLVFSDDFTKDAPLGSWATSDSNKVVYTGDKGGKWTTYPDGWPCTQKYPGCQAGAYMPSQVLSVQNGVLNFKLATIDGRPRGANPSPLIDGTSKYQLYGRYTFRFKVDKPGLSDWHVAWLMWPNTGGNCGGNGEIDFPEGRLSENAGGFHHHAIKGCKQEEAKDIGAKFTEWHTYTIEWTPDRMRYILDGKEVLNSTQGIPKQPMRWQLQTEIKDGSGEPSGNLMLDWVAVYKYQP